MKKNQKGLSLTELLVVMVISVMMISSVFAVFILTKKFYAIDAAGADLQRNVNVALNKIIKGGLEPGGIVRLSEAISYDLVSINELHFNGIDGVERWFKVSADGKSILYHHPTFSGVQDEVIYTVPAGAVLTLRFWLAAGAVYSNINLGVDVGVSQTVSGKALSGSATTFINIRNHPS